MSFGPPESFECVDENGNVYKVWKTLIPQSRVNDAGVISTTEHEALTLEDGSEVKRLGQGRWEIVELGIVVRKA